MANFNKLFDQVYAAQNAVQMNGPVIGLSSDMTDDHMLTENNLDRKSSFVGEAIQGIHEVSMLSELFFSHANMQTLQDSIRYQVYLQSGRKHVIGEQSENDLKALMRGVYLKHATHDQANIRAEIAQLNNFIIKTAVPQILGEILQHERYIYEQEHLPVPIDLPRQVGSKGSRTLEMSLRV